MALVKVPTVPKPPSSSDDNTSETDQKKLASGTEQFYKKNRSSNKLVSNDYEGKYFFRLFCKINLFYTNYKALLIL